MLDTTQFDQVAMDFATGVTKPGQQYSDKEQPKKFIPARNASAQSPRQSQGPADKAYQFITSLPVSSALLLAVLSQGVPINSSLWYLNYTAILVIALIAIGVVISYLSVTASHKYTETVFLSVYTPASQLFSVTVNVRDIYEDEVTREQKLSQQDTPSWCKVLLYISITVAATEGFTVSGCAYLAAMTLVYNMLTTKLPTVSSFGSYSVITALLAVVAADISVNGLSAIATLLYFLLTNRSCLSAIQQRVEDKNIEVMEGLEKYYTEGIVQLSEVVLTMITMIAQPYMCLMYIPIIYSIIYKPLVNFRMNVKKIQMESLCLSNFDRASDEEISSYDDVCAICLSGMSHARITPCKHIFHGKCLKDCLKKKPQCPLCNTDIL